MKECIVAAILLGAVLWAGMLGEIVFEHQTKSQIQANGPVLTGERSVVPVELEQTLPRQFQDRIMSAATGGDAGNGV